MNFGFHDMFTLTVPVAEKVIRTVVVYLTLIILLRVAGKRELGQFSRFDLVVLLTLSNTVQNAIIGNDNSLIGGIIGAVVLIGANNLANRLIYRHTMLQRLTEGRPAILVENGKSNREMLTKERISDHELEAVFRHQGFEHLDQAKRATLETNGMISVIPKQPTPAESRLDDLQKRLDRIERMLDERLPGAAPA